MSETLVVDSIALDLGFDMRLKLILSRAEQLVKQEGTALVESKSLTYSLQRKVITHFSKIINAKQLLHYMISNAPVIKNILFPNS